MDLPLTYVWRHVDGMAEDGAAFAETPAGRVKVSKRRPHINKFVVWVRGEVIGRDYINMDTAKRVAETKVKKILEQREKEARG